MKMKRQIFKKTLIAFLAMLFLAAAAVALLKFLPVTTSAAVEPLAGNTAEYTVRDGFTEQGGFSSSYNYRWSYSKTKNELAAPYSEGNHWLFIEISQAGEIELDWAPRAVGGTGTTCTFTIGKINKTEDWESNPVIGETFFTQQFNYSSGGGSSGDTITPGLDYANPDDKEVDIWGSEHFSTDASFETAKHNFKTEKNLQPGDVIGINLNGTNCGLFIRGLKAPIQQFTFNANVAEGEEAGGSIITDNGEKSQNGKLKITRTYGDVVTLTAQPNEGYYAYWTNDRFGRVVSYTNELKVSDVAGAPASWPSFVAPENSPWTYTVHFAHLEDTANDCIVSVVESEEGKVKWNKQDNRYTVENIMSMTSSSDSATLQVIFYGKRYVTFDYSLINKSNGFLNKFLSLRANNSTMTATGYFDVEDEPTKYSSSMGKNDQINIIEITIKGPGYSGAKPIEGESCYVENIGISSEPVKMKHYVNFDPRLADLYIDDELQQFEEKGLADYEIMLPFADFATVKLTPKSEVVSTMDGETITSAVYKSGSATANITSTTEGSLPTFKESDGSVSISIRQTSYKLFDVGESSTISYKLNSDEETLKLSYIFQEIAIAPKIEAEKVSNGQREEIENIEQEQIITFDFNVENSITLYIQQFEDLTEKDISILVDGEEHNGEIQAMGNGFVFPYQLNARAQIEISYLKEDNDNYVYHEYSLSFRLEEVVDGGIENIKHISEDTQGMVDITNDVANEWKFDPIISEADNYAYGLTVEKRFSNKAFYGVSSVSNIVFTMSGAESGSISLEFKLQGYYQDASLGSPAFRAGQLWYANRVFTQSDNVLSGAKDIETGSWKTIEDATWLGRPVDGVDAGMEYSNSTLSVGGGWYRVSIPVQENQPLYLGFLVCGNSGGLSIGTPENAICMAAIRNLTLATGEKNVTLKIGKEAGEEFTAKATVAEDVHNATKEGVPFVVNAGAMVTLEATPGKEDKFYGWSVGGKLVSTELKTTVFITGDDEIIAWAAPADTYVARAEGLFFKDIESAVGAATSGYTVYVFKDGITINNSFEIPEGVTLLLPYSAENKFTDTGNKDKISWIADSATYRYLTVNVAKNVTITIKGTLKIGGVVNCAGQGYQGHTSGAYSEMILTDITSRIVIEEGGVMDVYGRVTGSGSVEVKNGGKLYEPFLILDFSGGSNAAGLFMGKNPQTPFKRYAMINIECTMTINYGGQLIGHASLYALNQFFSLDQVFIGDDSALKTNGIETFVMLKDGSKVTITYNPDKTVDGANTSNCTEGIGQTKMVFEGGAHFSYMIFSAMGISVPTNPVYFSIPYNFDVELNGDGANYETRTDFMIMPGATVTVGKDATLKLNANAYVYDGYTNVALARKSYPTAAQLETAGYSKSGNLIVNGTLEIGKKTTVPKFDLGGGDKFVSQIIPATFLGIIQTDGTGRVIIPAETVVKGNIIDGWINDSGSIESNYYFEYASSARIYDSKTQKIVELTAGHEYTAKGAEEFTLVSLTYGKEVGKQDQNLTLNQTLHGSWMIVHAQHQYDWTLKEDEQNFGSEKTKDITRECTELGCTQKETRTLIKVGTGLNIGDLVYDGENVTAEELVALFKKYYGEKVNGFNFSAEFIAQKNHGDWDVTITIGTDNVYFYTTGNTADLKEFTFKYTITPAEIDGLELNADRAYNGTKLSNDEVIKAVKSGSLTLSANDYDVEIINNSADAGEYTVKVTGKNNFEGEQQATYTIKAVDITIKVNSGTATYAGKKTAPEINATHAQTGKFVGGDGFKSVTVVVKEVPGEWSAKTYELTVKYELNETTNKGNYKITVDDAGAILTVNKAQVTLTVKGKNASYNSKGGYDVAWELDGIDGFLGEYEAEEALKMLTITCDVNTNNTVGNHDINAVLNAEYAWSGVAGELENFTVTCKGGTYNISPVGYGNLSFGGEKSVTYDGKEHGLTLTVDDESVTVTIYYKLNTADDGDYKQDKPVNVGTYNVKAVLQSENYNDGDEFTFTTGGELVINPATIDGLTLTATSKKYDKQAIVPAELVESVTAGSLTLQKGDYDVKVDKDTVTVGDYTITVTGKGNYTGQKTATYKIEKKDITVTVYDQEKDYDNNSATLTQSGENVLKIADLCPDDDLGITLGLGTNASKKDKGDYPIIPVIGGTVVANNYNITFKNGTGGTFTLTDETHVNYPMYHIKAIKATVTIDDVTDKIYGDEVVTTFTHKTSGFIPGDSYTPTINYTCTLEEKPAANETGYDITGEVTNPNGNYEIEVKPGKYIIKQRPITVTINDQSSDYKHDHSYTFNANDWTTEDELAYDDDNAALQITLNHDELTDAGAYDITGSCANTNYKVTFKGSKEETKGVYTVNKLDISAEAIFWLTSEQGKDWTQDNDGYRVKYTGTPLSFTGHATYTQGDDDIGLQVTINPETVQGEGETSVTMTISDKNYAGSKTVTLVVTDADGYTARLREALASLEGLAEGMDSEAFKEEDFGKLKQMQQIISTLDEKEREVAQSAIEGYEQLIDDWNSLADADSIIVAAETIADAPINGLFEAAAVTMALISLAYIAIKGGLL